MADLTNNTSSLDETRKDLEQLSQENFGTGASSVSSRIENQLQTVEKQANEVLDSTNTSGPSGP